MVQLNTHDLDFILKQIKIAEANSIAHSGDYAAGLKEIWVDPAGNTYALDSEGFPIDSAGDRIVVDSVTQTVTDLGLTLAISAEHVPYGLRTVDGSYNNLGEGRELWGAADQPFVRLLEQGWRVSDGDTFQIRTGTNPDGSPALTTIGGAYSPSGAVADADPRLISNLVVDQTLANPAAIYTALAQAGYTGDAMAAVNAIRTEFTAALDAAKADNALLQAAQQKTVAVLAAEVTQQLSADRPATDTDPAFVGLESRFGLAFDGPSLALENVAPDEGLSAPYNSWFTLFGQFFDHGLDLVEKGGNDKIYIPLSPDDPLYIPGGRSNYMVLTRSPQDPNNLTTPFIDQNQTYSSTASKQLFLREYEMVDDRPVATGHLLEGAKGIATWGEVKEQARAILGIDLADEFVGNVPLFMMDAYGEFVRGPNGFPQVATGTAGNIVWVEGNPEAPVSLTNAVLTGHAFLDDIAHNAVPGLVDHDRNPGTPDILKTADADDLAGNAIPLNQFGQATTYDDELLDAHFVTGDGRGNENIGLTAVHHIFHSEHNKTVEQVKERAIEAAQNGDFDFLNEWLATDVTELPTGDLATIKDGLNWDGERLFQAARFTTEMQYQHLVFEEFARKIQPDIDIFVFNPSMDIDPSIFAEFAHVVYRFGHSMLNETVDSIDANGVGSSLDLFDAFLNPLAYAPGIITAEQGAGAIIRGMTGQIGNEIDEFVTDVLRNHLVGIPLDLPALNIARGRETGIPSLNAARAQFKEIANGDTQLDPYKNWIDFGMNLKNPASIVNFIAAYGTHATIASATTTDAKREAAMDLVFGDASLDEADRQAFLNGTGTYASGLGGLNDVDLWVGGIAEKKMAFGGMLGSTFSFVFELQMENLQNGDRFYYLSRTQGLNLLNELEANSLAELLISNTDIGETGYAVPGDIFSVPDHVLYVDAAEQAKWGYSDPSGDNPFLNALSPMVQRGANFIQLNSLDHALIQGTNQADTIISGGGDDTVWGRGGDDRIEAGYGVDKVHGGTGDDIITNSGTDIGETDFLMGEEGNDVVHGGSGLALVFGNQGSDYLVAGPDGKEMFGGEGNDFMLGGEGSDFLLGNEGDDWIEAGNGFDTTAGDNSELFFNSTIIGHDVMFAGENEHDFDSESGDDIMVQGESVMRNEGMWGYDWAAYKGSTKAADADLLRPIFTTEQQDILRNRFDAVEGLSGYKSDDVLKGDDRATAFTTTPPAEPEVNPGANLAGAEGTMVNHHLSQAGIDRINGLRQLLGDLVQNSITVGEAAREAEIAFDDGNILLGGGGSDLIEGRGGDDVIDGDSWLNVRIGFTHGGVAYTVDGLDDVVWRLADYVDGAPVSGALPAFNGLTLDELMFSRVVNPGALTIVREIVKGGNDGDIDTAVYWDNFANYQITANADGSFTVNHVNPTVGGVDPITGRQLAADGIDRLWNIEKLQFADRTVSLIAPEIELNGFDIVNRNWADTFSTRSYGNNNGTNGSFNAAWSEAGDGTASATTGSVQVTNAGTLTFSAGNADNASVARALNLEGASSAVVTFSISDIGVTAFLGLLDDEEILFEFAADGTNFTTLRTFDGNNGGNISVTLPTDVQFASTAAIRFRANNTLDAGESFSIDNVSINAVFEIPANPASVDILTSYTENGASTAIASQPRITDDGETLVSASIVLTNAFAGDEFVIPAALTAQNAAISATTQVIGSTIVVTLEGVASLAAYQNAIQSISYRNTSENPDTTQRLIEVTVNDGLLSSNVAETRVNVTATNDLPNAGNDIVITNIQGNFNVPDWALLANDVDLDGQLSITSITENSTLFTVGRAGGVTTFGYTTQQSRTATYTATDGLANDTATVSVNYDANDINGGGNSEVIVGGVAASTISAGGGNDIIFSGGGDDTVTGGTGDDIMVWNVGDGRDRFNGENNNNAGDTVRIEGDASNEAFVVYSRAAALANGITGLLNSTEIVITRNGQVAVELDNVEEIVINTGNGNDNVTTLGNFNGTSLNFNTITINGSEGDDTVNLSGMASAHRILFRSNGGNDTLIGTLRSQDRIEIPEGADPADYVETVNANGTRTLSNGTHSITFTGQTPTLSPIGANGDNDDDNSGSEPTGPFTLTARDVAGITNLVRGLPAFADDDDTDGAVGVRSLSGQGNNADNDGFGAADQPFIRLTEARYGEGVVTDSTGAIINRALNPIFDGLDPRQISNVLGEQELDLPNNANEANIFFMAFGQYFDHGLDFLPKGGAGQVVIDGVDIPGPVASNFTDLTRGSLAEPLASADDIPQHINKTSAYVDQNQVYGSNMIVGQLLRESDGNHGYGSRILMGADDPSASGFELMSTLRELLDHHREAGTLFTGPGLPTGGITIDGYYPTLWNSATNNYDAATVRALAGNFMGSSHALLLDTNPVINLLDHYVGGDGRTNENVTLTSMHTIWARNHNFHIDTLLDAGFAGTTEELFQAAKMVNEAEYQRVVFTEFADALIGGIQGVGDHGFEAYNAEATAGISHEFAAAVYRIGHSLIGDTITVKGDDGQNYSVNLFDAFLNPSNDVFTPEQLIQLQAMGYDPQPGYEQLGTGAILAGIVEQPAEEVDFNIVDAVRNDLVRIRADLFAFNVARGRDVGLGTLNQVKASLQNSTDPYVKFAVGFLSANGGSVNPYSSWQDFQTRNGLTDIVIAQFMAAYPDLVLRADQINAFKAINGDIVAVQGDGTGLVKGIDRVDLWVGGLAEAHFNGGMAGSTFWAILHEQFDRLQEADRFYYKERFDNFDLYENFIDGQEFADIIERNTGLTGLPEDIFSSDLEDGADNEDDDDDQNNDDEDDGTVDNDDDDDDEDDGGGIDDDEDDTDEESDDETDDDQDDDNDGDDDGDVVTPPTAIAAKTLIGTGASDVLQGAAGNDVALGGDGTDVLSGDGGADILRGESGDDVILGGDGDDVITGGSGADEIHAGSGRDVIFGSEGDDLIFADAGDDIIEGGAGAERVWAGAGNDTVLSTANDGTDVYHGEDGIDTLDYAVNSSGLTVDLGNGFMGRGSVSGGSTGSDTFYGFENFIGGSGHDVVTASSAVNIMDGGLGDDVFKFNSAAAANGDTIYGFQAGDRIDFSGTGANLHLTAGTTMTGIGDVTVTHELREGEEFTVIRGNTQGDDGADFELALHGRHNLTANDFLGVA